MNKKLDRIVANEYYQKGYVNGYKKARYSNLNSQNQYKTRENMFPVSPYMPMSYNTAVVTLLAIFIIFVIVSYDLNYKPGYISKYQYPCLLKISSTYSGEDCI